MRTVCQPFHLLDRSDLNILEQIVWVWSLDFYKLKTRAWENRKQNKYEIGKWLLRVTCKFRSRSNISQPIGWHCVTGWDVISLSSTTREILLWTHSTCTVVSDHFLWKICSSVSKLALQGKLHWAGKAWQRQFLSSPAVSVCCYAFGMVNLGPKSRIS
jgi:hypothetical protein